MSAAGHRVRSALLGGATGPRLEGWEGSRAWSTTSPGWVEELGRWASEAGGAEVIVSAGPYLPGRAAALVAGERPCWIDLPGDPLAELQALERAAPLPTARRAHARETALLSLGRGDAFSVIGRTQHGAALGELGLIGRLGGHPDPVWEIPIALSPSLPRLAPQARAAREPLGVACSGALNAWFDEETLIRGFEAALPRAPGLRIALTGGPSRDHHPASWAAVEAFAGAWPDRVQAHGWLPQHELPAVLGRCHLGLSLDRPGAEPLLGSRTRALLFLAAGLDLWATPTCDLLQELVALDLCTPLPPSDPVALAEALVAAWAAPCSAERARKAIAHCEQRFAPDLLARPLLEFVAQPWRLPPASDPSLALAARAAELEAELGRIQSSTTWRLFGRIHRSLRRLRRS